jgi:hypothetical protein
MVATIMEADERFTSTNGHARSKYDCLAGGSDGVPGAACRTSPEPRAPGAPGAADASPRPKRKSRRRAAGRSPGKANDANQPGHPTRAAEEAASATAQASSEQMTPADDERRAKASPASSCAHTADETENVYWQFREASARAETGDADARGRIMALIDRHPWLWQELGDLGKFAAELLVRSAYRGDPGRTAAAMRDMQEKRSQLCGPNPSPLVAMLVQRAVICWSFAQYVDMCAASAVGKGVNLCQWTGARGSAEKQIQTALKSLEIARRIAASPAAKGSGSSDAALSTSPRTGLADEAGSGRPQTPDEARPCGQRDTACATESPARRPASRSAA